MKNHREMLRENSLDNFSNFAGEVIPDHFLILLGRHRDSDILAESNWETVLEDLGGESETVRIDRIGHWAVGWVEYLSIDSRDPELLARAEEIEGALENYPVFDDENYSQRLREAADDSWSYWSVRERIDYIRKFRYQFEFHNWAQVRAVVRGDYFNGYASDLLH